jgi:hypothetical protein
MDKNPVEDADEFMGWLEDLDRRLMAEVINPSETFREAYQYFDSAPWKPLNPREFLQFWGALSDTEKLLYMLEFG